jgi:hypothetical protein
MTKHIKYRVKIPVTNDGTVEYIERYFVDKKDVCEFLEIDQGTFHGMCRGLLKYKQDRIKHLQGYIIEKIPKSPENKVTNSIDPEKFKNKLLSK